MSHCHCGYAEDEERRKDWAERREAHRLDDPSRHKNILERLQWLYRRHIKNCDYPYVRQIISYHPGTTFEPLLPAQADEPVLIKTEEYCFDRREVNYPTHRGVVWTCQGLTIAEEIEYYELHDMGR